MAFLPTDTSLSESPIVNGHNGRVDALSFSPNGKFLLSGGQQDSLVRLWKFNPKSEKFISEILINKNAASQAYWKTK